MNEGAAVYVCGNALQEIASCGRFLSRTTVAAI